MLKTVEGVFREGQIELVEMPDNIRSPTPVMVTFLEPQPIDLRAHGLSRAEAADLRDRLAAFAEDWESPEMDVYDDYEAARREAR